MIKDYQTKKQRLTKKSFKPDFNLSQGDDSWGFEKMQTLKTSKTEKVIYTILVVFVAYFVFEAIMFIATPKQVLHTTTSQSVTDYSDLKPLPKMDWNFTPLNQR